MTRSASAVAGVTAALLLAGCAPTARDYGPPLAGASDQPVRSVFFDVPAPAVPAQQVDGQIGPRDYPPGARARGAQGEVAVVLLVGSDGRVRDCRVDRSSGDRELDDATCALATQRFRYRPALNAYQEPMEDEAGWAQRWSL